MALCAWAQAGGVTLAPANAALQAGEADKALSLLDPIPQESAAEAHNLKCRVLMTLRRWDAAVDECGQATKLDDQNSDFHLWLGRALGEKADRASFLNAYSLAKRVREEFERAVELGPRNADALADLGEFYSDAPGVVGGGTDKAEGVAAKLDKVDASRAHDLRGHIAELRKDYDTAEQEFRKAIAASAHPATQWMTLASFYRRRDRLPEMESAVRSGVTAVNRDKSSVVALSDGASVLARANRQPQMAAKMLEDYLASPNKTEDAPAFAVWMRLAQLEDQLGDKDAAQRDRAAAQALAHDYKPEQGGRH
jgi:tetratricopeptide (TPR) repeat protein